MSYKNGRAIVKFIFGVFSKEGLVIGSLMKTFSEERFIRRLEEHEKKIKEIVSIVPNSEYEYFLGKVGRIVFERIEADDEDDKAEYLLIGFENCVRREMRDGSQVLYYFDLISALRMNDFIFLEDISDKQNIIDKDDKLVKFSINNLLNYGMISLNGISRDMLQGPHDIHYGDFKITPVGKELLNFIKTYEISVVEVTLESNSTQCLSNFQKIKSVYIVYQDGRRDKELSLVDNNQKYSNVDSLIEDVATHLSISQNLVKIIN